jgi:hypothetical protein
MIANYQSYYYETLERMNVDKEFPVVNNYCTGVVPSVKKTISHAVTPP